MKKDPVVDHASTPVTDGPSRTVTSVATYAELTRALADEISEIILTSDIICPENLLISHDLTLNLNGHSLISDEATFGARLLDIRRGTIHLAGSGKIFAMGEYSVAIRIFGAISAGLPDYTTLTIDPGVTLFAPDGYGIFVSSNLGVAYGLTINFAGQIFAHDGICLPDAVHGRDLNPPAINLADGAVITTDELSGVALTAAGYGHWQIGHAELRGFTGALLTHGQLHVRDTHIITSAPDQSSAFQLESITDDLDLADTDTAYSDTADSDRADSNTTDLNPADLEVTISGGAYVSERAPVIAGDPSTIKSFHIESGEFRGRRRPAATLMKKFTIDQANFAAQATTFLAQLPPVRLTSAPAPSPTEPTTALTPKPAAALTPEPTTTSTPDPTPTLITTPTPSAEAIFTAAPEPISAPEPTPVDDLTSARTALSEALAEIRHLDPDDYEVGFTALEAAIRQADLVHRDASSSLVDIRDTASQLLTAFDQLEERTELSLTDRELDELFYQGSISQETFADEPSLEPSPEPLTSLLAEPSPESLADQFIEPTEPASLGHTQLESAFLEPASIELSEPAATTELTNPAPPRLEDFAPLPEELTHTLLDFTAIENVFQRISELDLSRYTAASRAPLIDELGRAQSLLAQPTTAQAAIDASAARLLAHLDNLQPVRQPQYVPYIANPPSAPAPLLSSLIPAAMFDNLEPAPVWSLGITMIDEQTPFTTDERTRRHMQRALRPRLVAFSDFLTAPLRRFARNFRTACRAGISVYRANRRVTNNF